ncbi:hypothetical protein [Massilia endophytica]|uniref:hypothetical protein n=1 Tax=Massilia endophytica TaxID=2899220 RepID=UPI001E587307|nr:hypothetical protein [Massilia endophytica]UGQ44782.1 hypothetical protein LSQ66_13330 [Massilia endophytica]
MKKLAITTTFLLLAGCAGFGGPPPAPGESMAAVEARLGQPSARHAGPGGETIAEYGAGAFGQYTWMATYGPDGRLRRYEQVLSSEKFATVKLGQDNKESILRTFGRPAETMYLSLRDLEVWSYRYKESGVWNSMMHIHFSRDGIVREMQSGPDPLYEEKRSFF